MITSYNQKIPTATQHSTVDKYLTYIAFILKLEWKSLVYKIIFGIY